MGGCCVIHPDLVFALLRRALIDVASESARLRACRSTVGGYLYPQHAGVPETVQHLEIPSDGPDLAETAAVVPTDEPAMQLVAFRFLAPEDTLDHAALLVLVLVKELGRPASVGALPRLTAVILCLMLGVIPILKSMPQL